MEQNKKNKLCKVCLQEKSFNLFSPGRKVCKVCRNTLLRNSRHRPIDTSGYKICSKCNDEKPIGSFSKDKTRKLGYRPECKQCKFIKVKYPIFFDGEQKSCSKCKQIKLIDCFQKDSSSKNGYESRCKICIKEKSTRREKKDFSKIQQIECKKCNVIKDVNKFKSARAYICSCCIRKNNRRNTDDWQKLKIANDISYHLKRVISSSIRQSLRYHLTKKTKSTSNILIMLGYTVNDLKMHLENKFDKNMNWKNYGSYWHIDHIKPQSLFNIKEIGDKEFVVCWSLTNLQPLEAKKNMSKGNKYIG